MDGEKLVVVVRAAFWPEVRREMRAELVRESENGG
jgi:hypothetical protein